MHPAGISAGARAWKIVVRNGLELRTQGVLGSVFLLVLTFGFFLEILIELIVEIRKLLVQLFAGKTRRCGGLNSGG
jgi:hypothetical protein